MKSLRSDAGWLRRTGGALVLCASLSLLPGPGSACAVQDSGAAAEQRKPVAPASQLVPAVAAAAALDSPLPLLPEEVLAASSQHFPAILKSLAEQRAAEGRVVEALGAFDLVFSADGASRVNGFYDGTVLGGGAEQALRPLGAKLYSKYSVSDGGFPIYEDQNFTNNGGTLKVGALFSLLRDRDIDSRRFGEIDSQLALEQASLEVVLTQVGVQQRALLAYWRWVAAGLQLEVYENLLRIALEREQGLEAEVRSGRRAQIFLTENAQNITRRRRLVTMSQRDLRVATNDLAFYLRDAEGRPLTPPRTRLPAARVTPALAQMQIDELDVGNVLERRPELNILRTASERARREIALAENSLKPRVDLSFELAQPFGSIGEGGASRDTNDAIVGFTFELPLERRAARGKISQAAAKLEALRQEQRRVEDQIEIELRNLLLEIDAARELMQLAALEVTQSETMRDAEVARFRQGASDFFLVNLREEIAADARIQYFQAYRAMRVARANYDAAVVNLERLGLN